ncbi:MAG: hypothetical protein DRJ42_23755 [Deltaproteobacteria bacterium]|nr:MAG: hypothetical protein DRJ42_23755 [Deltaproteobacteria bacterium]
MRIVAGGLRSSAVVSQTLTQAEVPVSGSAQEFTPARTMAVPGLQPEGDQEAIASTTPSAAN